jgi:glutamine amidotransferase
MHQIGIIDYGMGNLGSVKRKLDRIKVNSVISDDPLILNDCDRLILPGVGHFSRAVDELKSRGLWDYLQREALVENKPILGICLGMQLMAKHSEEGNANGLGWFDADVIRFHINDTLKYKVPHMGWNDVDIKKDNSLFRDVDLTTGFYFVHSYHVVCNNPDDILCETTYKNSFVSAIQRDNLTGVQFHPEKSHDAGEQFLRNWIHL